MARTPKVTNHVLSVLLDSKKPMTANDIGASPVIMGRLARNGVVDHVGELRIANRRGRPQFLYKLNGETRKSLRNEQRKANRKSARAAA